MDNEIAKSLGWNDHRINLLKTGVCAQATNEEFELFLENCLRTGLDPFMKQIYLVKYGTKPAVIVVGIDGMRLIAERTNKYMPGQEPKFAYDSKGNLHSATAFVKRYGPDKQWHECAATAIYSEYKKTSGLWPSMPHVMLAKCAESQAIRRAFPADLSGIYSEDEMEQAKDRDSSVLTVNIDPPVLTEKPILLIPAEEAKFLEEQIAKHIAPIDADYRNRALKFYNKTSFDQVPLEALPKLKNNIQKKMEQIRKSEIPEITDVEVDELQTTLL